MKAGVLLFSLLLGCAALHPKAGDACAEGDAICQGGDAAILCRAGRYEMAGCRGPSGCTMDKGRTVRCDQSSGASDGEPCLPAYEGLAHCEPSGGYMKCEGGAWGRLGCGEGQCRATEKGVACVE